jgi:hypothetical protein
VPVHYDDQGILIVTDEGTAAVRFTARFKGGGAKYSFRFLPKDGGKEVTGEGEVFEKYDRVPGDATA